MALQVFFSYSHEDEEQRNQLEKHLASLQRQKLIEPWHDRRLLAGENIDDRISEELKHADIVLLLISASFIASDYCASKEMNYALERHTAGDAIVIPVIVKNCDWQSGPFARLNAVPKDAKPITSWPNPDDAYTDVAKAIRAVVEKRLRHSAREAQPPASVPEKVFCCSNSQLGSALSEPSRTPNVHRSRKVSLPRRFVRVYGSFF